LNEGIKKRVQRLSIGFQVLVDASKIVESVHTHSVPNRAIMRAGATDDVVVPRCELVLGERIEPNTPSFEHDNVQQTGDFRGLSLWKPVPLSIVQALVKDGDAHDIGARAVDSVEPLKDIGREGKIMGPRLASPAQELVVLCGFTHALEGMVWQV